MAGATIAAWVFDEHGTADNVVHALTDATAGGPSLHKAATICWPSTARSPRFTHVTSRNDEAGIEPFWDLLFGVTFFIPLLHANIGSPPNGDALSAPLYRLGVDLRFLNSVRDHVVPRTSALFVLSPNDTYDSIVDALDPHRPSIVLQADISAEQESKLLQVFGHEGWSTDDG